MIRAKEITESIAFVLNERAISNIEDIDAYIKSYSKDVHNPEIKRWLEKRFRSYIINDYGGLEWDKIGLTHNEPQWMKDAREKQALWKFNRLLIDILDRGVALVIQFFSSNEAPNRIDAIDYEDALKKAEHWKKQKDKEARDLQDPEGTKEVLKVGSLRWVEILSKLSFDREGIEMHHCLRNDKNYIPDYDYYSLRDKNNKPHFTLEVDNGDLNQAKGYSNGEVEPEYRDVVIDFINNRRISKITGVTPDGDEDLTKNMDAHWDEEEKKVVDGPADPRMSMQELLYEVGRGRMDFEELYSYGADLERVGKFEMEAQDDDGNTLFMLAAKNSDERMMEHLLDAGANINASDHRNETVFMWAVKHDNYNLFKFFENPRLEDHKNNIDWEAINNEEQTVMDLVLQRGNIELLDFISYLGASIDDAKDSKGRNILQVAYMKENEDYFDIYCQDPYINHQDNNGDTVLSYAVRDAAQTEVEKILNAEPDLDIRNHKGQTALEISVNKHYVKIAALLLEAGADLASLGGNKEEIYSLVKDNQYMLNLIHKYLEEKTDEE
jgi:ankyrin repeat protein